MITSGKRDSKEKTVSKEKGKKRGRKSKLLTPIPGQDVDIPLVVGGALIVGDTTFSPLTGRLNSNKSSLGHSIGTTSYDDATIGENTVAREMNDEKCLMRMTPMKSLMVEHQMLRAMDTNVSFVFKME